jgi:hypothetical protein
MGRYYYGTISGKFWYGVQCSHDASSFKDPMTFILPKEYYSYYGCGCEVEEETYTYCHNCYSDYDSHINSLDDYDIKCIKDGLIAYPSNHAKYEFDISELYYIKNILQQLENDIGKDIIEKIHLVIYEEEKEFEYDLEIDAINNLDDNKNELIARWCFGKQIEKALINTGYCYINCEL